MAVVARLDVDKRCAGACTPHPIHQLTQRCAGLGRPGVAVCRTTVRSAVGRLEHHPFAIAASDWSADLKTSPEDTTLSGGVHHALGFRQVRIIDNIEVRMPTAEEAELMSLSPGTAVGQYAPHRHRRKGAPSSRSSPAPTLPDHSQRLKSPDLSAMDWSGAFLFATRGALTVGRLGNVLQDTLWQARQALS
jgi:hypothetical protein